MLTSQHTWIPYLYLYGVGGLFFLLGMIIIRKSGSIDLRRKSHRMWNRVLIFGFFWFMVIHAILIYAALNW
ncbi:MAG: hypothetical protein IIB95_02900 [Candidatus Marinimicrobia bacterium]|nr:hypothetical protein [Candidatus Neomarinimicrobiota bacterium]MCH7762677.1 hypothetical protein [Candidatus Neomarinimicrobiota bacterium]